MTAPGELNERQRLFAERWAEHGVARRAAIEAGYGEKNAMRTGTRLTQDVRVADIADRLRAKSTETAHEADVVTVREVLLGLKKLAEHAKSQSVRRLAWRDLGTHLGMFVQRIALTDDEIDRAAAEAAEEFGLEGQEQAIADMADDILRDARRGRRG